MKKTLIERKISIVEKEIKEWETKQNTANVNLRKQKEKLWELIEQLELVEGD